MDESPVFSLKIEQNHSSPITKFITDLTNTLLCANLVVPATCVSLESVFSTAGNVVTKKRNKLSPESVHNLVFLHGCHGVGWKIGRMDESDT